MSGAPAESKAALRHRLRGAVAAMTPEAMAEASARIRSRLAELPVWRSARTVLGFHPLPAEPNLWPLLESCSREGRSLGLLRFDPTTGGYVACEIPRGPEDLVAGRFGVIEPGPGCPRIDANRLDLILVPGIGFTLDGDRLGRGKGYYDRFLSGLAGFKCGVAFDGQVTAAIPVGPHDVRLDGILTPTRWHPVTPRSVLK